MRPPGHRGQQARGCFKRDCGGAHRAATPESADFRSSIFQASRRRPPRYLGGYRARRPRTGASGRACFRHPAGRTVWLCPDGQICRQDADSTLVAETVAAVVRVSQAARVRPRRGSPIGNRRSSRWNTCATVWRLRGHGESVRMCSLWCTGPRSARADA